MYIEEIILDGFKSYQRRTVVGKFHPCFNAITGLNGSGKSNILDSICFVLGITNLSQIRINKLEELVYKAGQAGINKASVSIVFNNNNKSNSPPLYKDYEKITVTRQIATGGRNRYLINGLVVKPSDVTNFFHSVQLNVNSSHFLIMQGRITKVINMKPKELLSMIEEAAGTRMYEAKRLQSLKLIEKKDSKLAEINHLLEDDIIPKLERLKKEKADYLKWTNINEEIEMYERILKVHQYLQICKEVEESEVKVIEIRVQKESCEQEINILTDRITQLEKLVHEEESKIALEWSKPLKECRDKISEAESNVSKTQLQLNEIMTDLDEEEANLKDMLCQKAELESKVQNSAQQCGRSQSGSFEDVDNELNNLKEKLSNAKLKLQALQTGCDMSLDYKEQKSLRQALFDVQKELSDIKVKENKFRLLITENEKSLSSLKLKITKRTNNGKSSVDKLRDEHMELQNSIYKFEGDLLELKKDAELYEKLSLDKKKLEIENDSLEQQLQPLEMFIRSFQCIYNAESNPKLAVQAHANSIESLLDPSIKPTKTSVKGCVFELLKLRDQKYATALEVAAGGRLYNMIVETSEDGKQLLNSGFLKKRTTLIPLDKIIDPSISKKTIDEARKLAQCTDDNDLRVISSLDILEYDIEYSAAIKYCFGHTLICEDEQLAKLITFHPNVGVRTVTMKGDIYDPSGTLSGGTVSQSQRSILISFQKYIELKIQLAKNNSSISDIKKKLSTNLSKSADSYRHCQRQLDINKHQLTLLEEKLSKYKEESLEEMINELMRQKDDYHKEIAKLKDNQRTLQKDTERLENEINMFETTREVRENSLEKDIEKYKEDIKSLSAIHEKLKNETSSSRIELEAAKAEIKLINSMVEMKEISVAKLKENTLEYEKILESYKVDLKEKEKVLKSLQNEMELSNSCIRDTKNEIKRVNKLILRKEVDLKKISHDFLSINDQYSHKLKAKDSLIKKHEWLRNGVEDSYNLEKYPYNLCIQKLEELDRLQNTLSRNINRRILNLYERANSECTELINKRDIVMKDKEKIADVISDLDLKKRQAMENTWRTVNNSFGSIFSTLLPNSNAELIAVVNPETNKEDFYEGLEFRVSLGGIWKKSLSELSGGQRSLLALSLILAMLRFKPAPVYILDEIDSALDLGHTQNIGYMIKEHFPNSQFIIVSLKEGMFNKADVLFRTELVHGVSSIHRFENWDRNEDENQPPEKLHRTTKEKELRN
ncbi:structural maintenance of chromosomes protein [Cryptosporidium andersoni]|uniref:Structural maintenance of chromosomes protein n=1 Tax=Cryptosporidium andersoni TaxID=117008 RepID=A0A1J4MTV1_9CRYT|nr:structural maintenance of chromosomes protein [Cryptosporidium andersoni]